MQLFIPVFINCYLLLAKYLHLNSAPINKKINIGLTLPCITTTSLSIYRPKHTLMWWSYKYIHHKLCTIGWAVRTSPLPTASTPLGVTARPLQEGVRPSGPCSRVSPRSLCRCGWRVVKKCKNPSKPPGFLLEKRPTRAPGLFLTDCSVCWNEVSGWETPPIPICSLHDRRSRQAWVEWRSAWA